MKFLTLILISVFASIANAAECDFRLTLPNATVQPSYSTQTIELPYVIERRDNSNGPCSRYRLYFSKGFANSYQRRAINFIFWSYPYNLHQNVNLSGVLKERNDALNSTEYVSGNTFDDDVEYNGSFYLSLPALSTSQRTGTYLDIVQVSIYRVEANGDVEFERTQNFSVYITVPTELSVSVVNEGDQYNENSISKVLDFGNLEPNAQLGADIIVKSNTPYQLKVSSFNNGKMVNQTSSVSYQMTVNGSNIPLSTSKANPVTIATSNQGTGSAGTRYNAKIKILPFAEDLESGTYTDSITITAIAN